MSVSKIVAENIRTLRTQRGLSQEELASALFVTRTRRPTMRPGGLPRIWTPFSGSALCWGSRCLT